MKSKLFKVIGGSALIAGAVLLSAHNGLNIDPKPEFVETQTETQTINLEPEIKEQQAVCTPAEKIIDCELDGAFQQWAKSYCDDQGVDFYVIMSIIYHESRYQTDVTNSSTGCMGLMQLHPEYHQRYLSDGTPLNMYAPCINVMEGISTLKEFLEWSDGDLSQALFYYSGGDEGYADRVFDHANVLRKGGNDYGYGN